LRTDEGEQGEGGDAEAFGQEVSPDGQWVVYVSERGLWKIPIDGGDPVRLTEKLTSTPVFSPDGKLLACWYWDGDFNSTPHVAVMPAGGGPPVKMFDLPPAVRTVYGVLAPPLRWTPDGGALAYAGFGGSDIWRQPLDGSAPQPLTNFRSEQISSFAWSSDGKRFVLTRGFSNNDVVLISDLR
jgi:Tol biopolymer transport system component